jgi:hypothetical protein
MAQKNPPATDKPAKEAPPMGRGWKPAMTAEERLKLIEQMRQRINGYVDFMCAVGGLAGSSAEAKEAAVAAFYDRFTALDQQLGRICDDLRLG